MSDSIIKLKESYWKPTPKRLRKLGDSFIIIGTTITGISAYTMPPWVTLTSVVITAVGKILTNFFSE